ncbi:MAG: hypothetical protein QXO22_04225 [Thermosphaera sp.]
MSTNTEFTVIDTLTRICNSDDDVSPDVTTVKCLQKGAVEMSYLILSSVPHALLPPDDEPPISVCFIGAEDLKNNPPILESLRSLGVSELEAVTITTHDEDEESGRGKHGRVKTYSTFAVMLKGRRTGALYTYIFMTDGKGGWVSVPVPRPHDERFYEVYVKRCFTE